MGAIEDLAAALAGVEIQKQIASENPYFSFQQAPELVSDYAAQFAKPRVTERGEYVLPQQFKTRDLMTLGIGGGLLSGLLGGLGDDYQNTLTNRYTNAVNQTLEGKPINEPNLPKSLFTIAKQQGDLFKLRRQLENQELKDRANIETDAFKQRAQIQDPVGYARAQVLFPDLFKKQTDGQPVVKEGAAAAPPTPNPAQQAITDYTNELMTKYGGDEVLMRAEKAREFKREMPDPIDIPGTVVGELSKSKGVIDEALSVASLLDKSGPSWTDLQTAKAFSGADKEGIGLALKNLADKLARARTGAAMNKEETTLYNRLVGGDLTASPKQVANLLRKLADAEGRFARSQLDFIDSGYSGLPGLRANFETLPAATQPTQAMPSQADLIAEAKRRGLIP